MNYLVVLGDGMADHPVATLGGKTPLEAARTPVMDALAGMGRTGLVRTVPAGLEPGSDVANLAVLGLDPEHCYTGRAPLEALGAGIAVGPEETVLRCNLVTLSDSGEYEEKRLLDHSAGEVTTAEADRLMDVIRAAFNRPELRFYTGTGFRQLALRRGGGLPKLEAPHDCLNQTVGPHLPEDPELRWMMRESFALLQNHPVNRARAAAGKPRANSLWFWGAGTKPNLASFRERTGLRGAMITGVDLLRGIAAGSGMEVIRVPGATGGPDTDYEGKAAAAAKAVLEDGMDFVYVHVEAPDEMGHAGDGARKVEAIENLDARLIGPLKARLDASGEPYRLLVLPDHPTPVELRRHTGEPVPYILYDSTRQARRIGRYSEAEAALTGDDFPSGAALLSEFLADPADDR